MSYEAYRKRWAVARARVGSAAMDGVVVAYAALPFERLSGGLEWGFQREGGGVKRGGD